MVELLLLRSTSAFLLQLVLVLLLRLSSSRQFAESQQLRQSAYSDLAIYVEYQGLVSMHHLSLAGFMPPGQQFVSL